MNLRTFTIKSKCVMDDDMLYSHIESALKLNLPVIGQYPEHNGVAVLVGSGPTVEGQIESIRSQQALGRPIIALKDAHDWLLDNGIVPDYASAIDPQENQWKCFKQRHNDVKYLIASQCHPSMFRHLEGFDVSLWHLYVRKNQSVPPHGTALIGGGTTTGLRTITLFYSLGFRHFELYGYDSCLKDGILRRSGWQPTTENEPINEIVVEDKIFYCNPAMTAQAHEFQNLYTMMPDINIESHGDGLITAIIEKRKKTPLPTVSFIHRGSPKMASYRYRAAIPAEEFGVSVNDLSAGVLIIAKPDGISTDEVQELKKAGKKVVIDFCDDHFNTLLYRDMLSLADHVICPTEEMAARIKELGRDADVIDDPYEFDEMPPHCSGTNLLWFGHAVNYHSLKRILPSINKYPLTIVSNIPGTVQWSMETMRNEFALADIVVIPATATYKSPNRTVEAIRQGCFVVAEPHPSLTNIPGIWLGDIKDGIEWASQNLQEVNHRIQLSQAYVRERFNPRTQAFALSKIIRELNSTSEAGTATGKNG